MHDCYQCGQACYCHGDIDDCPVETEEYAYEHCVGCGGCDQFEEDYDDWCDYDEPPTVPLVEPPPPSTTK